VSFIPGKVHEHNGKRVYHRADGALLFHGRRHSEYSPQKDRKHHTRVHPEKSGYPHAGDGRPKHVGTDRPIHAKKRRAKKGRRGKR